MTGNLEVRLVLMSAKRIEVKNSTRAPSSAPCLVLMSAKRIEVRAVGGQMLFLLQSCAYERKAD